VDLAARGRFNESPPGLYEVNLLLMDSLTRLKRVHLHDASVGTVLMSLILSNAKETQLLGPNVPGALASHSRLLLVHALQLLALDRLVRGAINLNTAVQLLVIEVNGRIARRRLSKGYAAALDFAAIRVRVRAG